MYVRTTGIPGRLLVTRDGGGSFEEVLSLTVPVQGFALSPDGKTVLATNAYDGSYRADTESLSFEKLACRGPSCLLWNDAGLFGCGDDQSDGFIVGRSRDDGATFERVVDLSCVRGPLACDASTIVGSECPTYWPTIRTQLGADECAPTTVTPYTGCFSEGGAGGDSAGNATSGGTSGGGSAEESGAGGADPAPAGAAGASGSGAKRAPPEPGGCGLTSPSSHHHWIFLTALGSLLVFARRRATRRRQRTTYPSS